MLNNAEATIASILLNSRTSLISSFCVIWMENVCFFIV